MTTSLTGVRIDGRRLLPLDAGWELARTAPGACATPAQLAALSPDWRPACVPGTVGASLHADRDLPGPYDADDWWYRVRFSAPERPAGTRVRLHFEGLATIADAWLNGAPLVSSRNMFVPCAADVTDRLAGENELAIRFASLDAEMAKKRPRPRWRTALVARQDLRWIRTTLLGRMPGWTPPIAPVGPWRAVTLECVGRFELLSLRLHAGVEGGTGRLRLEAALRMPDGLRVEEARVRVGGSAFPLAIEESSRTRLHGDLAIPDAPLWWPHTHGAPRLVDCRIEVRIGRDWIGIDAGRVGFRRLVLDQAEGRVRFRVNGVPVFCRGACWTPLDIVSLGADAAALRSALEGLRDAGANMLRIPGNTVYESDAFYALCDELGILVWQDFMFANMDYPAQDPGFRDAVEAEARAL
ncbi:MAG TPA: hypothetical protein VFO24_13300, partial [Usitatibacter sp.]|nr:hypothetical protein [Usitatibacter sp.]